MHQPLNRRAWSLAAGALLATLAGALAPTARAATPPTAAADYASERASAQGLYRVAYTSESQPVPVGRLHAWTLRVLHADGRPVTAAVISVDGDMPEHRHGLPTRPRVTRNLGNGEYLVEGIKFQMGGWWVMDFDITADGRADRVRFNLQLKK